MPFLQKCATCGYQALSTEEETMYYRYGCCRAKETQGEYSKEVELCAINREQGGFYPPGTHPDSQKEDPDALHELFCKKYEKKEKPKTNVDKGNNNTRN